jgi:hypothetical protein
MILRPHLATWLLLATTSYGAPVLAQTSSGVDLGEDEADAAPDTAAPLEQKTDEGEDDLDATDDDLQQDTKQGQTLDNQLEGTPADAEDPKDAKYMLGARYRMLIVPQFLINAFGVDGGRTIVVHGVGPEFGFAMERMDIIVSAWYANYGMEPTPFKGPNDGPEAWEIVESELHQVYISADLLWKQPMSDDWDFVVGAGAGLGIVFGNLYRNEAYWVPPASAQNPGDPYTQLAVCNGPGDPNDFECPNDGTGSYGDGDPWPVYPWLTFQTGVRYSPVKEFVGRLDLGIGSSGFWFGLGLDYGI